jgi:polyhydroxyalkanoate synthesis regulator phasin
MIKEATYKEKFDLLTDFINPIMEMVKREVKNDHLRQDFAFAKRYFPGKQVPKLTIQELAEGYKEAVKNEENGESIAEFILSNWLLKHGDLYHYFEEKLSSITQDFTALQELSLPQSETIVKGSIQNFGAYSTYLFAVINSVVFPKDVFTSLEKEAKKAMKKEAEEKKQQEEAKSFALTQQSFQDQIARLTDKYEKKLLGLQKKYTQDVESLKKQVATLQKKLDGK